MSEDIRAACQVPCCGRGSRHRDAPIPRSHRRRVAPKTHAGRSRSRFDGRVGGAILGSLLVGVPLEVPRHPATKLLEPYVDSRDRDLAYLPLIAVALRAVRDALAPIGQLAEGVLRALAECLALLRCIDAIDANAMRGAARVTNRERVAIGDGNYLADNELGTEREGRDEEARPPRTQPFGRPRGSPLLREQMTSRSRASERVGQIREACRRHVDRRFGSAFAFARAVLVGPRDERRAQPGRRCRSKIG